MSDLKALKTLYDEIRRYIKKYSNLGEEYLAVLAIIGQRVDPVEFIAEVEGYATKFCEKKEGLLVDLPKQGSDESWKSANAILAFWKREFESSVIKRLLPDAQPLFTPDGVELSHQWHFMDYRQVFDDTHPALKECLSSEGLKELKDKMVRKALKRLAAVFLRAHAEVIEIILEMLKIGQQGKKEGDAKTHEGPGHVTSAELEVIGATGGVRSRNPASKALHLSQALADESVKNRAVHHLANNYCTPDQKCDFFDQVSQENWAEAEEVLNRAMADWVRRDNFYSLITAMDNLKRRTDDRVSVSFCYSLWRCIAPHLTYDEQAYVMALIGTKLGSARDNQALFAAYSSAPYPVDVLCEAFSTATLTPEEKYKLIAVLPEQFPATYAEMMAARKNVLQTVGKQGDVVSKSGEHGSKGKNHNNNSNRYPKHFMGREDRPLPSMMGNAQAGEHMYTATRQGNVAPQWTRTPHQQHSSQSRDTHIPMAAPVNLINHSHDRYMPYASCPSELCSNTHGQRDVPCVYDENKLNLPKYPMLYNSRYNMHYSYDSECNGDSGSTLNMVHAAPPSVSRGGHVKDKEKDGQNSNKYTLYDDIPSNHVFINSVTSSKTMTALLSRPLMVNGCEIQALIDTGSAYSIIDPTLAADPRINAYHTQKNVLLSSIAGPMEVPIVVVKMKSVSEEDIDVRCAVTDLSKSCNDRLLIGYPDLLRLGYHISLSTDKIEIEKRLVSSEDIVDPSADFDEELEKDEDPEWYKHPFWQKYPNLLRKATELEKITPDRFVTFPGSAMPIHTDEIEANAYSNLRLVQGEMGIRIAQEIDKWRKYGWVDEITQVSHDRIIYIPLLAVTKKNGDLRVCLDFRRFNSAVLPLECSIPRIMDFQETSAGKKYFTEIDLKEAFMQLPLDKNNYYKLGLRTMNGYYILNRAPFGLYTVPAHFQATIDRMVAPIKGAKVYFDNVVIASETLEEHAATLERVLDTFLKYNVRVNMAKLQLCKTEMRMLGMIVSGEGIRADPEKISKCLQMKKPQNTTEMRRLIGAVNFLRIFFPHASALMSQLNGMINDKSKIIKWTPNTEQAFNTLRKALTREITLFFPKPNDQLVMYVDASDDGIAGALGVMDGDKFRVWKLHSKNISKVRHWSPTMKELFALVSSLTEFYPYIFGRFVMIYTDHQPLVSELRIKEPNKQIARWFEAIAGLQFRVEYVPGKNNVLADFLSRVQWETDKEAQEMARETANVISTQTFTSWKDWQREQRLCLDAARSLAPVNSVSVEEGVPSQSAPQQQGASASLLDMDLRKRLTLNNAQVLKDKAALRAYNAQIDGTDNTVDVAEVDAPLVLDQEQGRALFNRDLLWTYRNNEGDVKIFLHGCDREDGYELSQESEWAWISLAHADTGHGGNNSITAKLSQWNIDFPGKLQKIQEYLDGCTHCMRAKAVKHQYLPQRNQLANQPFAKIAIDVAQLPSKDVDEVSAMLVVVDVFTRYTWALPLKNLEDTTVARALVEWMWDHSTPVEVQSDQGTHFVNDVMKRVVDTMRIVYNISVPYYPQSNGVVERAIGTIKTKLNVLVAQSEGKLPWSTYMKAATQSMNTAVKTYHGQVPFDMLYAIQAVPPVMASSVTLEDNDIEDALQLRYEQLLQAVSFERDRALQRIDKLNNKRNEAANKNRIMKPLQVGDVVLAKVLGKDNTTNIRWFGPYVIHEIDNMSNYIIKAPNGSVCLRRFPRSHLKKADMRMREKKMVADKIVDARMVGGKLEYKVGFQGYNKDSDVWVSAQVAEEKYPTLLARFEGVKQKLMMEISLEEGQKLSELLDDEELAVLDNSMSAPRMGLSIVTSDDEEGVAAAAQDAPLGSRFAPGEGRIEGNVESTHTLPSQRPNAEPQIAGQPSQSVPVQRAQAPVPVPYTPNLPVTNAAGQLPAQVDDYDTELQELRSTFRDIERRRNAPSQTTQNAIPLPRNPAAEARHRFYAQQYYGSGARGRGYGHAPRGKRKDDDNG